jgi:integration host factor subunit beta
MTKSDLIERLCQDQKLAKGKAELLINSIFDCLEQALRQGDRIEIRGFGSFEIREYKGYQGRNPKTGLPVPVRKKRLPFFKVGKELKERVNNGSEPSLSDRRNGNGQGRLPPSEPSLSAQSKAAKSAAPAPQSSPGEAAGAQE